MEKEKSTFEVINDYINSNFQKVSDSKVAIDNVMKFDNFLKVNNYSLKMDELMKLINENTLLNNSLELIFKRYQKQVISGVSFILFNNNTISTLLEFYCTLHNIDFVNSVDYSEAIIGNNLKYYLLEINKIPLLSSEEEKDLTTRIYNGEKELCSLLIQSNLRLVVSLAFHFQNQGLDIMDLIQEGNIGLMKAAYRFNPSMGYKFSTYASISIKRHFIRAIQDKTRTIRIPNNLHSKIMVYKNTVRLLYEELGRRPSSIEVADKMNISVSDVDILCECSMKIISINTLINDDDEDEIGQFIPDYTLEEDDDHVYIDSSFDYNLLFSNLNDKEKKVLEMRYGLCGYSPMTLEQIAKVFNLCRERIRQIELRALRKIRMSKHIEKFEEYMPNPDIAHKNICEYKKRKKLLK